MKKIICLFLLLNTLVFSQQSNWKFINPLPDGESFLSIKAVGNKLFACGCFGKIIASEDKGNTWSKKDWLTVRNLFEVEFYDENTGLVVGGSGDIFKTTNGGKKWIRKTPPENVKLKDVEYINKDLILAVGEGDYTYRSTDGGETWNALKIAGKPGLWGLCYNKQSRIGLACGWGSNGGVILRTTDDGLNWKVVTGITDTIAFYDVNFIDDNTAIAVGGGIEYHIIKKSTDGGQTWRQIDLNNLWLGYYSAFESVKFADKQNGTVVGHSGVMIRTTDGGETWQSQSGMSNCDFDDVEFADAKNGYVVGAAGIILKTTDAGATWKELSQGDHNYLSMISFSSPANGAAVGALGTVVITNDGGKSWTSKPSKTDYPFFTVKMIDAKHILAAGWRFDTFQRGMVALTTDGGESWTEVTPPYPLFCPRSIDFFDSKNGLLAGFSYNTSGYIDSDKGEVYKTTDGGMTWQKLADVYDPEGRIPPMAIKIFSPKNIIMMGEYGSFLKSTDEGKTWQPLSMLPVFATTWGFQFLDEMTGIVSNMSGVYKTVDGGKTWKVIYNSSTGGNIIKSVHFSSKNTGYAVGEGATSPNYSLILKTIDGGENWDYEFPPTVNPVNSVFALNDTLAFIAGGGGTILTNGKPGIVLDVRTNNTEVVKGYSLSQNYPNPFNPSTVIKYSIPKAGFVTIKVYDLMGKEVAQLVNKEMQAGSYDVHFNPVNLASGVYFYKIQSGSYNQTRKMIYMR